MTWPCDRDYRYHHFSLTTALVQLQNKPLSCTQLGRRSKAEILTKHLME